MTERSDFFSLMFFIVAIGNLVAYALLGWLCNIVSQVRRQPWLGSDSKG
jgi:ATP-binding cassette, subfamily B (MDR/TAP), member 1